MKLRVLIVEDEELVRNELLLTTPWERFGCEPVGSAENGMQGEELINALKPDIVITDIRMPGQDGITMLENTMPPAALILSGYSDFHYARKAIRLGVMDYILKPVDDEELYGALEKVSKKLRDEAQNQPAFFTDFSRQPDCDKQDFYIKTAIQYIEERYASDISLGEVAGIIGITESYLSRLFKLKTGDSFLAYIRNYRLTVVLEELKDQTKRINEVARDAGFHDMSYFSSQYKKYVGMTPNQYQNGYRQE